MKISPVRLIVLSALFFLSAVASSRGAEAETPYRAWLLELGAVPEDRVPKKVRKPSKHDIVYGWVNPCHAASDYYVPKDVQKEFGIPKAPLTYDRYVSFLLVDDYKKNKSSDLYALMLFSLDQMWRRDIPIPTSSDLVRVYKAGIGLEEEAVRLLAKAPLPPDEALALFEQYADVRLISLLKVPVEDKRYVETVRAWSDKEDFNLYGRFLLKQLLAGALPQRFQADLRDFTLQKVSSVPDWWQRLQMYMALRAIGDQKCWDAINGALLHDPVTETREQILLSLQEYPDSPTKIMDAVLKMTEGGGEKHYPVTPSRSLFGYEYRLAEYLKWANARPNLDDKTREKIQKGIDNLRRNPSAAGFIPKEKQSCRPLPAVHS
ncbi:MAG: hypothetical protein NTX50_23970 [Candidatus Sumerlaeota bacterium]|nr:hypothetical protein [Candidatus Sumerlaeota bacterium]